MWIFPSSSQPAVTVWHGLIGSAAPLKRQSIHWQDIVIVVVWHLRPSIVGPTLRVVCFGVQGKGDTSWGEAYWFASTQHLYGSGQKFA